MPVVIVIAPIIVIAIITCMLILTIATRQTRSKSPNTDPALQQSYFVQGLRFRA